MIRTALLLVCIGFLCTAAIAQSKPDLFVVSVGVKHYKNKDYDLKYPDLDAQAIAQAWAGQTDLYEVHPPTVLLNEKASQQGIRQALKALGDKATQEDLAVFFFSGHGKSNGLCPWDFDANLEYNTAFSYNELRDILRDFPCNYIVLLDACFSASFTKVMSGGKKLPVEDASATAHDRQVAEETWKSLAQTDKQTMILCSSASNKVSDEDDGFRHGYLTKAILNCMAGVPVPDPANGKDITIVPRKNGFVYTDQFEKYVKEASRALAINNQYKQSGFSAGMRGVDFALVKISGQEPLKPYTDTDLDGFDDNKNDECPGEYGTLRGCLDTDGDGVADKKDDCKFEPGLASNRGCPVRDTDGDGVADAVDKCRDTPGKKEWQGCPDSDSDGIPDHLDECPEKKGVAARNGCPNTEETPSLLTDPLMGAFVLVKGGTFTMGCKDGRDSDCESDETAHEVTLSNSYYMGQTEVTQAQWRAVMGSDPTDLYNKGCDQCPVERVSWNDIQDFLSKLNSRSGGARYRLPTEAEWEYAARGGPMSRGYQYAGSNNLDEVAWYKSNSGANTKPVKGKAPNELGLYDMSGNVWEWCSDWYGYYPSGSQSNPSGPATGSNRIARGGPWFDDPNTCRVSHRVLDTPDLRGNGIGFRLARTL